MKTKLRLLALTLATCHLSLVPSPALRAQSPVADLIVQRTVILGNGTTTGKPGTISPAQLTADSDDWAPTGFAYAFTVRVDTDASHILTGLAGGAAGRVVVLENIGAEDLVLTSQDTASSAANRFALTADFTVSPDSSVMLKYDGTSSRWRIVGSQGGTGGGAGTVTNTSGNLTSNYLVLGAGTVDTKVAAGLTTDGTSKLVLGVAGTAVGSIDFKNATSGTINLAPPTGALGTVSVVLPLGGTLATLAGTETLTNKTLGSTIAITAAITFTAGVKQTFAPDATNAGFNAGSFAGVPSSLSNGDLFYDSTANALKARINGSTVSLGSGGGSPGGSDTFIQYNNAGAFGATPVAYVSSNGTIRIPSKTLSVAIGDYGSISETGGGLAYITGNSIKASTTVDNQLIKTTNDPGIWMRMRYDSGISFHTNVTGSTGTTAADDANQRAIITLGGNLLVGTNSETGLTGAGGLIVGSTTDATSSTAGALILSGGLAVAKKIFTADSITTGAPSGGTAAAWKFGIAASVSPTAPDRTVELDVGGTRYFLAAKTTND